MNARFTVWLLSLILALVVGAVGFAEEETVRFGTLQGPSSVTAAPFLTGDAGVEQGLAVDVTVRSSPDALTPLLIQGELDAAAVPVNLAAILRNRGVPIRTLGISGEGMLALLGAPEELGEMDGDGTLDWDDLRGREIHMPARGATPDILFKALAREHGLEAGEDYRLRYAAAPAELASRAAAGRASPALLPEPFVTQALARQNVSVVMDLQDEYRATFERDSYPMTVIVVTEDFVSREDGKVAQLFSQALGQANELVHAAPEDVLTPAADKIGMPEEVLLSALDRLRLTWRSGTEARAEIETLLGLMAEIDADSVGGDLPGSEFYVLFDEER